MRGLLLALALVGSAGAVVPGEVGFTIDQWGGINTQVDSSRIGDFDAQSADNVLTDRGRLEKRTGNTRLTTILDGYQVQLVKEFIPSSLTRYLIAHASSTVYQTDFGSTPTALSTTSPGTTLDAAQALNQIIFQDGARTPWYWNGTSTDSIGGMPVAKFIEYANERVVLGNLPSTSGSRVAVSSYGSVSYFTVPANVSEVAEAPNTFDFQREDGDQITCLKATRCGVFVGKNNSTHILKGYDNLTFRKDVISANIGCADDRSVQDVDGMIVWLAADAVYAWACSGRPEPISRDIDPIIKTIRQSDSFSASWVLNSQADFEAGIVDQFGARSKTNTTISPGSVVPSTFTIGATSTSAFAAGTLSQVVSSGSVLMLSSQTFQDSFDDGDYTTGSDTWTVTAGSYFISGGLLVSNAEGELASVIHTTNWIVPTGYWSFKHKYDGSTFGNQCADHRAYYDCFEFRFYRSGANYYAVQYDHFNEGASNFTVDDKRIRLIKRVGGVETTLTTTIVPKAQNTELFVEVTRSTGGVMNLFADNVWQSSTTDLSITGDGYSEIAASAVLSLAPDLNNRIYDIYYFRYSTGSWTSPIYDTGLSTPIWGAISSTFTTTGNGSNVAFYVRASTASDGGGFGSWSSSSDTVVVTADQRRFAQLRADFTAGGSTRTPTLSALTLRGNTSAYYYSPVRFIGSAITAYSTFDALDTIPSGASITYSVRAATYAFPASNVNLAFSAQDNHELAVVAVSTPAYFQYRALLQPVNGNAEPSLDRSSLGWDEGLGVPVASGWKDGRYFLCVTISTAATYPDRCLIRQRNGKWVTASGFSAASMTRFNNDLVVGDGSTASRVWKIFQDDVYNDDGAAIASEWISKDFMFAPNGLDWPTGQKSINEIWLDARASSSTYQGVAYAVDRSTSYSSSQLDLGAYGDAVNRIVPFSTLPGALGKSLRIKLSNSDLDKNPEINGFTIYGVPKERTLD